ncbi:hypothetical protein KVR01_006190 [Diaporthe batatas]|uniref:uncharacterized protein n=1 Tax=Diaporthe batatas TaxID=748121 RepID=UPI001D03AD34|nr:uncharacterized protein KVR01_006190 [Diaporthe batatas]KAG8164272.1 hypothetical protein KVR01_006190 [Diaporthe batatas]
MLRSSFLSVLATTYIPCLVTALACRRASECAPGLTAWSDANFAGTSHQYNVSWDTCVSIAAQFPFAQPGGVSSLAANEGNWCTVYPNTDCNPGQGNANDTLNVVGSYYDLANPEDAWDNLAQSFSCKKYNCE